jgi:hypothetical protein
VFLGSATAVVAAGAGTLFSHPVIAQRRGDPVVNELRRQLRAGVRQMRGVRPGEGARAVSTALTFATAYGRSIRVDAQFQAFLRRAGKWRLTDPEIDPAQVIGMLRDHGLTESRLPPLADLATRQKVYDLLLANGLTGMTERAAQSFSAISPELDKLAGVFRPVIDDRCRPIMDNISIWSGVVTIACGPLSLAIPGAGELACAAATGALLGYLASYWTYC